MALGTDFGWILGPSWAASWGLGRQVGVKWPSWAHLKAVLGRLGGDLGGKLGPTGRLGRVSGASWRRLGPSWAASWGQVAVLGAS